MVFPCRLQEKESVGWNQVGSVRGCGNSRREQSWEDGMKPRARRELVELSWTALH